MNLIHPGYAVGGADISKWQYPVNFNKLLSMINFIIVRAGSIDGGRIMEDIRFADYWREIGQFPKGAYWYFHPGYDPKLQAECFVDSMKRVGMYTATMGLYTDLEEKNGKQPSYEIKKEYTEKYKIFHSYVDAHIDSPYNKYSGVYTGNPYWTSYIDYSKITNLSYRTSWIAQYPYSYPMDKPTKTLPGFSKLHMWQFSRKGGKPDSAVVGDGKKFGVYSFGLDSNVWLGTEQEFENWFHCKPAKVDISKSLPKAVKPFQVGYNMRSKPDEYSTIVATTYTSPIEIMGAEADKKGRLWYQVGKSIYLAAWLGESIYDV